MSGSANTGTIAERHTCELPGSAKVRRARSSEITPQENLFLVDKDWVENRISSVRRLAVSVTSRLLVILPRSMIENRPITLLGRTTDAIFAMLRMFERE
jgi:hypothetical protein